MGHWALLQPPRHPLPSDARTSKPAEVRFKYATDKDSEQHGGGGVGHRCSNRLLLELEDLEHDGRGRRRHGSHQRGAGGTTVTIELGDTTGTSAPMTLTASPTSVKAGPITFTATNKGTIKHELIVLSTTTTGADLKPNAEGEVSEANNVGEIGDVEVGKTGTATITLKPGTYILACNIKDHYKLGMWLDLTVTA
jgi:uncharacterized cupredoxin-like copper-binding protein